MMASSVVSPNVENQILQEAVSSPAVAMMRLSLEVDRQLRLLLAAVGSLRSYSGSSPVEALALMENSAVGSKIPLALRDTLKTFWDLRNRIVHSSEPQEAYAMRAIDYGLRIVRMLMSIPRPSYIVRHAGVLIFSDSLCQRPRPDVTGVIIESFGLRDESFGLHIHPSRRQYVTGQSLSWEWGIGGTGWGDTWYRSPENQEIKQAWSESLEFIGRPLDLI